MSRSSCVSSSGPRAVRWTPKRSVSYRPLSLMIGTIALPVRSPASRATSALYTLRLMALTNLRHAFSAACRSDAMYSRVAMAGPPSPGTPSVRRQLGEQHLLVDARSPGAIAHADED